MRSTSTGSRADLFLLNASSWRLREENTGSGASVPFKKSPKIPTTASFPGTKNHVKFFFQLDEGGKEKLTINTLMNKVNLQRKVLIFKRMLSWQLEMELYKTIPLPAKHSRELMKILRS